MVVAGTGDDHAACRRADDQRVGTRPHRHRDRQRRNRRPGRGDRRLLLRCSGPSTARTNYSCGDGQYKLSNASGEATFTYTSSTSGQDTIYAYADGNGTAYPYDADVSDSATKNWTPPPPDSLTLSPTDAPSTTVTGVELCETATVRDSGGNLVAAGFAVKFTGHWRKRPHRDRDDERERSGAALLHGLAAPAATRSARSPTTTTTESRTRASRRQQRHEAVAGAAARHADARAADRQLPARHDSDADGDGDRRRLTRGRVEVIFNISSVHGARPPITEITDANGRATISYSSGLAVTDTTVAFADTNLNDGQDAGEANDTATTTWTDEPPAS